VPFIKEQRELDIVEGEHYQALLACTLLRSMCFVIQHFVIALPWHIYMYMPLGQALVLARSCE
jgi:hypothetical protein